MIKTSFISYSWKTKDIADKIANDLAIVGVKIVKDNLSVKEFDNLKVFMDNINKSDYTIVLLSDEYLKSRNCMYEILELFKSDESLASTIPILTDELNIFHETDKIQYTKYWQERTLYLENELKSLNPINTSNSYKELKILQDITYRIGDFLNKLTERKLVKYSELIAHNYLQILEKIEIEESVEHIRELLNINFIGDSIKQLTELEKYHQKHGPNSFYYYVLAKNYSNRGKISKAIKLYETSLELDGTNFEVLNNLGYLEDKYKNNHVRAEKLYKKSIELNPKLSISRLNYAVLLNNHNRTQEAIFQNKEVLKFEPSNPAAHSNLGTIYKSPGKHLSIPKAEKHLKKCLEHNPEFVNGLINYANFLKVYKKNIKLGNRYYKKALEITDNENTKQVIAILMESEKG